MADVYLVNDQGESELMTRLHCKDEDKDLQHLLELNPNLLPGDQIDPDDPRRWLLIKREMPVQDPNTGGDRWSIDFFFVDQSGIPTFVECKRFRDTRSRREVVGQMLEYAANGQRYWTKDVMLAYAQESALARQQPLEAVLQTLAPDNDESADSFFERVATNLLEGQVRLIFFLEEAPAELTSIVDFLNKQMERSEVLLVEARQYTDGNIKIVVPVLFGYTEQARQVKKVVAITPSSRGKWDEALFFKEVGSQLKPVDEAIIRKIYELAKPSRYGVNWGTGSRRGSFNLKYSPICPRSLVTVWTDGILRINFGWLNGSEDAEAVRDAFAREVSTQLGWVTFGEHQEAFPEIDFRVWSKHVDTLISILNGVLDRWSKEKTQPS